MTTQKVNIIRYLMSSDKPARGTIYLNEDFCKGCAFCVLFCPVSALAMKGKLNKKGYHLPELVEPSKCTGCDLCGFHCPDFAIVGVKLKHDEINDESDKS